MQRGHSRIRDGARFRSQQYGGISRHRQVQDPSRTARGGNPLLEQAIRLSPGDPGIANLYFRIGEVHLLQSRTDKAILWLEKARNANARLPFVHAWLASAYALKGETEHAAAELAEARRVGGENSWSSIAKIRARTRYEAPTIRALSEATFFAGLRKAGMPEE
jgi:tetratricopeptide (TPR) repeat protein